MRPTLFTSEITLFTIFYRFLKSFISVHLLLCLVFLTEHKKYRHPFSILLLPLHCCTKPSHTYVSRVGKLDFSNKDIQLSEQNWFNFFFCFYNSRKKYKRKTLTRKKIQKWVVYDVPNAKRWLFWNTHLSSRPRKTMQLFIYDFTSGKKRVLSSITIYVQDHHQENVVHVFFQ